MSARRVVATGRVQGVNFRASLRRVAEEHGVVGWVRNRPDGAVEAQVEGDDAAVAAVIAWIAEGGPPGARVEDVDEREAAVEGAEGFAVRG